VTHRKSFSYRISESGEYRDSVPQQAISTAGGIPSPYATSATSDGVITGFFVCGAKFSVIEQHLLLTFLVPPANPREIAGDKCLLPFPIGAQARIAQVSL